MTGCTSIFDCVLQWRGASAGGAHNIFSVVGVVRCRLMQDGLVLAHPLVAATSCRCCIRSTSVCVSGLRQLLVISSAWMSRGPTAFGFILQIKLYLVTRGLNKSHLVPIAQGPFVLLRTTCRCLGTSCVLWTGCLGQGQLYSPSGCGMESLVLAPN